MNKRGQLQISFGMIFSIILIVFFLVFAFFGIKKFLGVNDEITSKKLIDDLNYDIDKMWKSSKGSEEVSYSVPRKVEAVCFGDDKNENIYYFPRDDFTGGKLTHLDIHKTLDGEEKLCIPVENKKVNFVIDKDFGETLVVISKEGRDLTGGYNSGGSILGDIEPPGYFGDAINSKSYEDVFNNPDARVLFHIDFENRPYLGKYETLGEFMSDWRTGWETRGEEFEIVRDPGGGDNKVGMFTYPYYDVKDFKWVCWDDGIGEDLCSDSESKRFYFDEEPTWTPYVSHVNGVGGGGQWYVNLDGNYNEAYVLYSVKFSPGFDGLNGGKLFGFSGSGPQGECGACTSTDCRFFNGTACSDEHLKNTEGVCDGIADDFTTKHMFHTNSIDYYVYHYDKVQVCGDGSGVGETSYIFDGNWHTILFYTRMNDVNEYNGLIKTWIDGEEKYSYGNLRFRVGENVFGIQELAVTTFFGGSSDTECSEAMDYGNEGCNGKKIAPYFAHGCLNNDDPELEAWCQGLKSCVADINDPCSDILRYSDGSPFLFFAPRKTEYLFVDNIVVYVPN